MIQFFKISKAGASKYKSGNTGYNPIQSSALLGGSHTLMVNNYPFFKMHASLQSWF